MTRRLFRQEPGEVVPLRDLMDPSQFSANVLDTVELPKLTQAALDYPNPTSGNLNTSYTTVQQLPQPDKAFIPWDAEPGFYVDNSANGKKESLIPEDDVALNAKRDMLARESAKRLVEMAEENKLLAAQIAATEAETQAAAEAEAAEIEANMVVVAAEEKRRAGVNQTNIALDVALEVQRIREEEIARVKNAEEQDQKRTALRSECMKSILKSALATRQHGANVSVLTSAKETIHAQEIYEADRMIADALAAKAELLFSQETNRQADTEKFQRDKELLEQAQSDAYDYFQESFPGESLVPQAERPLTEKPLAAPLSSPLDLHSIDLKSKGPDSQPERTRTVMMVLPASADTRGKA